MSEQASMVEERPIDRSGEVLRNKWRLDRLLGAGGMASVYAATHRNGKRAAVKLLHPELAFHEEIRKRFLREGYAANKVDHPGAVSVLDDDVAEDGSVFLVMELLEGESLSSRAERSGGALELCEVFPIADQLLNVLAAAHDKGIVHRDIKPENVFISPSGSIKVLDFGIARLREVAGTGKSTRTGTAMGTPAFMSPEQARGRWEQVDGRTDLWAVGATMFTLLTGKMVHEADTVNELLLEAMTAKARPVQSIRPDLPEPAAQIIDRALAFDPKDRWSDAREMQDAVRQAQDVLSGGEPWTCPQSVPEKSEAFAATLHVDTPNNLAPITRTGDGMASGKTGVGLAPEDTRRSLRLGAILFCASAVLITAAVILWRNVGQGNVPPPSTASEQLVSAVVPVPKERASSVTPLPPATAAPSTSSELGATPTNQPTDIAPAASVRLPAKGGTQRAANSAAKTPAQPQNTQDPLDMRR
jgi:serine/threonine-protein kinase